MTIMQRNNAVERHARAEMSAIDFCDAHPLGSRFDYSLLEAMDDLGADCVATEYRTRGLVLIDDSGWGYRVERAGGNGDQE